jgi:regulatory protein
VSGPRNGLRDGLDSQNRPGGRETQGLAPRRLTLKARALMLLARREHSRSELRAKLLPMARLQQREAMESAEVAAAFPSLRAGPGAPPSPPPSLPEPEQQVEELLAWLEAHAYLSEQRFVESRVHARAARYGNLRIRQELAEHGLALDAGAQQALRDSELGRAQQAWQRKFDALPQDVSERARQMRFLSNRGFSPEVIRRVLRGVDE